jgi:heme/copper-type cytochrome/quinol oxidase subunit 2
MNNSQANTELIFTLFMMGVLLVLGVAAVVVFFRLWRKERKAGGRKFFE